MEVLSGNNTEYSLLQAVLFLSNSLEDSFSDLDCRYKTSISNVYRILTVLYFEKTGLLEDKLHRQINYVRSINELPLFINTLNLQIRHLGINDWLFLNYKKDIEVNKEYFTDFIRVLRNIASFDSINIEFFGYLYEYFQQYNLADNFQNSGSVQLKLSLGKPDYRYIIAESDNTRKKQGSFFTPPELIDRLINSSLAQKIDKISSLGELLEIRILDPACGGGNILLKTFNYLYNKAVSDFNQSINPDDLKRLILKNCIYGIDIDYFACEITKLTLFLAGGKLEHLENISCRNFLIEKPAEYKLPEFSLIIGNPPYLNIQNITETGKKYYLLNYRSAFRRFDLYILFVEKALGNSLKKDGTLAFIVPDKILTQSYGKKIRQLILENHTIKQIISYETQTFFKNACVTPVIIVINKSKIDKNQVKTVKIKSKKENITFIDQDSFSNSFNFSFRISWNVQTQEIIELIQTKSFPLQELCYISWGAQPGDAKKFIFNNINLVKNEFRNHLKPLIRGGNVDRYKISYSKDYLLYLTDGILKLHRPAFKELFESEKIVIAEVTATKGIIASIDNQNFYTNHSIINCIHKNRLLNVEPDILKSRGIKIAENKESLDIYRWKEQELAYTRGSCVYKNSRFNSISLKYALSLINSKLINFYFKNFLSGNLNVFPELIRFLPVFDIGLIRDQNTDTDYPQSLLDNNDPANFEMLLNKAISDKDYPVVHNILALATDRLVSLNNNVFKSEFMTLDNIVNNAVYGLYELNEKQIQYIETS
ncbi:MAG: N-6 DNA methylase [Candidatus Gastranaerophilales bacterium]|nr:N-6 DNA methylase [Candidatus Gastranaerophilales bacterium]